MPFSSHLSAGPFTGLAHGRIPSHQFSYLFRQKMKEEMRMCQNESAPTIKMGILLVISHWIFGVSLYVKTKHSSWRERNKTVGGFTLSFFQKSLQDMVPTQYELPFEGPRCIFEFSSNPRNRPKSSQKIAWLTPLTPENELTVGKRTHSGKMHHIHWWQDELSISEQRMYEKTAMSSHTMIEVAWSLEVKSIMISCSTQATPKSFKSANLDK